MSTDVFHPKPLIAKMKGAQTRPAGLFFQLRAHLWLAALLGLLIAPAPGQAYACSCAATDSPQTALAQAAAVFVGQVERIDVPAGQVVSSSDPARVTLAVSQVLKGPATPQLTIQTERSEASCGYSFMLNQVYLVYASGSETDLHVSLCSRTRPVGEATEDLALLGPGTASGAPPVVVAQPQAPIQPTSYAVGWGTLALINAGLAQGKNRSAANWFLISLLLGPIATFLLVALYPKLPSSGGEVK